MDRLRACAAASRSAVRGDMEGSKPGRAPVDAVDKLTVLVLLTVLTGPPVITAAVTARAAASEVRSAPELRGLVCTHDRTEGHMSHAVSSVRHCSISSNRCRHCVLAWARALISFSDLRLDNASPIAKPLFTRSGELTNEPERSRGSLSINASGSVMVAQHHAVWT